MNELVIMKNNEVFTDSLVIANNTNYEHHSITRKIRDYKKDFEELGKVGYHNQALESGQKQKIYLLNEMQATLLITYLENNEIVRKFKLELVRQFYMMRKILLEKQTALWQDTRLISKTNRLKETDCIKLLVEYAKSNGSKNADKYYMNFSKLANKAVGLDSSQRDMATTTQLNNLILIENIINNVIKEGIKIHLYYKDIYKACKDRIETFKEVAYLTTVA